MVEYKQNNKESAGEDLIKEFLKEQDIKFKYQQDILNLVGDDKFFRIADFYLPQYKIYVEYFGQWDQRKHKARYNRKRQIYWKNKIPCIYLYPDNLGILDFIFKRRLRKVLRMHHMGWQLFKFNLKQFMESGAVIILAIIGYIIYSVPNYLMKAFFVLIFIYSLYEYLKTSFLK